MSGDWRGGYNFNYWPKGADSWQDLWSSMTSTEQGLFVGFLAIVGLIVLTLLVLQIIGMWKAFGKAKQPGWAAIVPFYNTFISVKIAGLELWWFVLIAALSLANGSASGHIVGNPEASVVVSSGGALGLGLLVLYGFLNFKIAKSFGKDVGFAVGLTLLPPIFWMILGYSRDAKYRGPAGPYKIDYPDTPKKG